MSSAEVDEFIRSNDLDDGAASALKSCSTDVLRAVLDRGDLRGARNPSSAVMMRIKDAKAGAACGGIPSGMLPLGCSGGIVSGPDADVRAAVDEFLRANDVDERAAESLRACPAHVQKVVLGRGDLSGARNPSSALLTRIKDAKAVAPGEETREASAASAQSAGSLYGGSTMCGCGSIYPGIYGGANAFGAGGIYGGCGQVGMYGGAMPGFSAGTEVQHGISGQDGSSSASYVKMRGLPFSAIKEDILHFFSGFRLSSQDVTIGINSEGRPSGEAFVRFASEQVAKEAIRERNRERMDHRYIELFPMTPIEAQRANLPGIGSASDSAAGACGACGTCGVYGQAGVAGCGFPMLGAYGAGFLPMGYGGCYGAYGACGAPAAMQPCAYGFYPGGACGGVGAYGTGSCGGYGPAAGQGCGEIRATPY